MNNDEENKFVPIDLSPELQRESELRDLLWMRDNDPWQTPRHEIKDVLLEMNLRMTQYISQFVTYSLEFLAEQTMRDFNKFIVIKQHVIRLKSEPVALLRDSWEKIYINPVIVRSDFEQGGVMIFLHDISSITEPNRQFKETSEEAEQKAFFPPDNDIPF